MSQADFLPVLILNLLCLFCPQHPFVHSSTYLDLGALARKYLDIHVFFNKSKSDKFIHNVFSPALLMPEDTTLPNASHLLPPPVERLHSLVQLLLPCVATPLHPHVGQFHPHVGQLRGLRQGSSSDLQTAVKESPTTAKITIWSGWTFLVKIVK